MSGASSSLATLLHSATVATTSSCHGWVGSFSAGTRLLSDTKNSAISATRSISVCFLPRASGALGRHPPDEIADAVDQKAHLSRLILFVVSVRRIVPEIEPGRHRFG